MRFFGQAGLGRPDQDIIAQRSKMVNYFKKNLPEDKQPEVNVAIVFTDKDVKVDAKYAPTPTYAVGKVKNFIRSYAKEHTADPDILSAVKEILPKETID